MIGGEGAMSTKSNAAMPPVGILAGGLGTRLSEETDVRPKPMVEVGGQPILWHLMKTFASFGVDEYFVALGYLGSVVKDYFVHYRNRGSDLSVNLGTGEVTATRPPSEDWRVHLLDTGLETQTGGRVKRMLEASGRRTIVTYGDGLCSVDIHELLRFHESHGKLATVTAVRPPARFGELRLDGAKVERFSEKPQVGEGWINGGFFVLEPEVAGYIPDLLTPFEGGPIEQLVADGQLMAYRHAGFWQCMDTLRDLRLLRTLWDSGEAPWAKKWR